MAYKISWLILSMELCLLLTEGKPTCDGERVWDPDINSYVTCRDCEVAYYPNCKTCCSVHTAEEKPVCDGENVWASTIKDYVTCQDCKMAFYPNCKQCCSPPTDKYSEAPSRDAPPESPSKDPDVEKDAYWNARGGYLGSEFGVYIAWGATVIILLGLLVACLVYIVTLRLKMKKLKIRPEKISQGSQTSEWSLISTV